LIYGYFWNWYTWSILCLSNDVQYQVMNLFHRTIHIYIYTCINM
jgi:hypothetical protein